MRRGGCKKTIPQLVLSMLTRALPASGASPNETLHSNPFINRCLSSTHLRRFSGSDCRGMTGGPAKSSVETCGMAACSSRARFDICKFAFVPGGRTGERITAVAAGIALFAPIPGGKLEDSTPVSHKMQRDDMSRCVWREMRAIFTHN